MSMIPVRLHLYLHSTLDNMQVSAEKTLVLPFAPTKGMRLEFADYSVLVKAAPSWYVDDEFLLVACDHFFHDDDAMPFSEIVHENRDTEGRLISYYLCREEVCGDDCPRCNEDDFVVLHKGVGVGDALRASGWHVELTPNASPTPFVAGPA